MKSVLRQFIREALINEAVGIDKFFTLSSDTNPLQIPKTGLSLNNALLDSIKNSPYLSSVFAGLTSIFPSATALVFVGGATVSAAVMTAVGDGADGPFSAIKNLYTTGSDSTQPPADTFNPFMNVQINTLRLNGADLLDYADPPPTAQGINLDQDYFDAVKQYYTDEYNKLCTSTDYNDFFAKFSELKDTKGAIDTEIAKEVGPTPPTSPGASVGAEATSAQADKKKALEQWAYCILLTRLPGILTLALTKDIAVDTTPSAIKNILTETQKDDFRQFVTDKDTQVKNCLQIIKAKAIVAAATNPSTP